MTQAAAVLDADHRRRRSCRSSSSASAKARLFDPLAFSKTFAMAFSTLLTLFLLPIVIVWVFKRGSCDAAGEHARARFVARLSRAR